MSDDSAVYALSPDLPPLTVDGLWKKIVRYLAQGSGDPCVRRILEETLVVLSDIDQAMLDENRGE
jgi:hypothetical protein